jgi:mRNA-degrading endonuclease RelE of RelBE toxin-antitoxin system
MSYRVVLSPSFKRSIARLKRFRHVKDDVRDAVRTLLERPELGAVIPGGGGARKLRVRNSDISKGKSGGYRLIYYVETSPVPTIYLLLMYSKLDKDDVTRQELEDLIREISASDL